MSTKNLFLTHDMSNTGKKSDYLPMTGATCNQNSDFMGMTHATGAQR
jgi:hypothetical protein